jgi:HD-like signal output (HDOD) protein
MSNLAETVQKDLLAAIERDDLMLPTLPEVALQIREAAEDRDINVSELSKVIGRDIALSARLIKVVNSPLLRGSSEVTALSTAITRLGVNYSCNLAIGLVMEQIFNARSTVVEQKMRDIWTTSVQIAGIAYELCRHSDSGLKPDQAALAGMIHQIGALPILIYAEEHNELLSDPICLNHVIDRIHPLIGERILKKWDFPAPLANVPECYLHLHRDPGPADYADIIQIASLLNQPAREGASISSLDSWQRLGLGDRPPLSHDELASARQLLA